MSTVEVLCLKRTLSLTCNGPPCLNLLILFKTSALTTKFMTTEPIQSSMKLPLAMQW